MASSKILTISYIDGVYHYMEVEKKSAGFFPGHPQTTASVEALAPLCRTAGEIHLSSHFFSAAYQQALFPKVARRYVPGLVARDAAEKMGTDEPLASRYTIIKEVSDAGVAKWQTAYCAVPDADVMSLWDTFRDYSKKIKLVAPLSVAVASMVAHLEKPDEHFAVVWVGPESSLIVIASPDGLVNVARTIPLSLSAQRPDRDAPASPISENEGTVPGPDLNPEAYTAAAFSMELDKELGMSTTFFKQEYRQAAPKRVYLLGDPALRGIFEAHPLPAAYESVHFELSTDKQRGLSPAVAGESVHLLGNLYVPAAFNFMPRKEVVKRQTSVALNAALVLLVAGLGLAFLWSERLHAARSAALNTHTVQTERLQQAITETASLKKDVNRLKPLEGWKRFYDETIAEKPPWNMFISELSLLMEDYVVINSLEVLGGRPAARDCRLRGKIRADNWEEGLELFREFGRRVESSPLYEVSAIRYTPEGVDTAPSMFDFQMDLRLKRAGGAR